MDDRLSKPQLTDTTEQNDNVDSSPRENAKIADELFQTPAVFCLDTFMLFDVNKQYLRES